MTSYEEWRVTGTKARGARVLEDWSEAEDSDAEAKARHFIVWAQEQGWTWADGPHLSKRTVTVTDWKEVEA